MLPFGLTSAPLVFTKVIRDGLPIPRRLVAEGGLASNGRKPPPDDCQLDDIIGIFHQRAEITLDSFAKIPFR